MRAQRGVAAIALAGFATAASAAADVSVSVGGEIAPGVYGRIDIGTKPPPVVYSQPVIITAPAPSVVVGPPVYMNVPPGHARNWAKHCHKYDACGQQVYFVKTAEYDPGYAGSKHKDDHGHGNGKGKGNGNGKGQIDMRNRGSASWRRRLGGWLPDACAGAAESITAE